jgi:hypothetical protein
VACAKKPAAVLTAFLASMKAPKSASFLALSRSLRTKAYATAAPAAAPSSVPSKCVATPPPLSDVVAGAGATWGTTLGADTLLVTLGAFEMTDSAGDATAGAVCEAEALTTLLPSE